MTKEEKLTTILRNFRKKEMRSFGKFLEGTAEREPPNQIALFNYLSECHPKFHDKKMKREYIAKRLFPNASNPNRIVRDSMSNLCEILEDFIAWKELKKQPEQYNFLSLKAYKSRKLDDIFFDEIKKIEKASFKRKTKGIEQLYNNYLLKKVHFTHPSYRQEGKNRITYKDMIELLDEYYFAEKLLWTSCLRVTQEFVNTSGADFAEKQHLIQEILRICLNNTSSEDNQIKFLAEMLNVLITENFQNYPQLEQQFISNLESFNEIERNDLMELLCHISLRDSTVGRQEAFRRAFELNKQAVEKQWIFRAEPLSAIRFLNIVSIARSVGELEWARYFIDTFGINLSKDIRNDIKSISHATVDFKEGLYDEVTKRLLGNKFKNILYEVYERAILLQCYYELNLNYNESFFLDFARAFKGFLRRKCGESLTENFAQGFLSFIRFACRLRKNYRNERDAISILEDIKSCDNVVYKGWLIEKAGELVRGR